MSPQLSVPVLALIACFTLGCRGTTRAAAGPSGSPAAVSAAELEALGRRFAAEGDLTRAEQYLSAAVDLGGGKAALTALVRVCVQARHLRMALDYAEAALRRRPGDAALRFVVGALYVEIGEAPQARPHLETAATALPNNAEVQFALGVFYRDDAPDPARADRFFRRYLELRPSGAGAEEARASLLEKVQ